MPMLIAMLRGVNVGGAHKMPMAQLRSLCEGLGFGQVATLIQSGNVVFEAADAVAAGECLEAAIAREFGFGSAVIVRTAGELRKLVGWDPFAGREKGKILVTFLQREPEEAVWRRVRELAAVGPEELEMRGREMVCYYPEGQGRSKFPMAKIERALACATTSRNWNTVEKLLAMAER